MTREEAIEILRCVPSSEIGNYSLDEISEALTMAIEALQTPPISQRSMYQAGYRQAQEDRSSGDLISRAEAIEAMGEEPPVWCDEDYEIAERDQWRADIEAIESVPSADRPMVIKCEPFLSKEDFKTFAEQVRDQNVILIPHEAEVVSTNTSTNTSTKSTNISTDTSADRPRGEWIDENGTYYANCSKCGYQMDTHEERGYHNFCPNCGADMRGEVK